MISKKFLIKSYIWSRNKIVYNFGSNIRAIVRKNNIYYSNFLWQFLRLIPFSILDYFSILFNFNIIYQSDNIFNITNVPYALKIMPIIINLQVHLNNDETINLKNHLKNYNSNIPVRFFLKNNNINIKNITKIETHYMKAGRMCLNTHFDYNNMTIYDLFN